MEYSIKEAAQMLNIPISTIRYYDKEGLLPSSNAKARATARFRNATSRR
ncbi:MerR family DNA-binding transcriptional regulator [Pyramidobacter piscolens]|nr:MerR family DNA-binding transcriptional regulator [Pyramidobacter piscolens]